MPALLKSLSNVWIYGRSGCGKSARARYLAPGAYIKNMSRQQWPDYEFEEDVIIDDWSPYCMHQSDELKLWTDRYAFQADIKYGGMRIRPKRIIITSQYSIEECFSKNQNTVDAIKRRFTVEHMPNGPNGGFGEGGPSREYLDHEWKLIPIVRQSAVAGFRM